MTPRTVIVTGAARGIGKAIAVGMLEAGASVVGACRPRPSGSTLEPELEAGLRDRYLQVEADVTRAQDCVRVVTASVERFGSVDVLVNNAALSHEAFPDFHATSLSDLAEDAWWRAFETNVLGPFLMARAALPEMIRHGWGRIVNISTSKASMLADGALPYGPSKAALAAMTVGWARQLAEEGITVNEVLPGGPTGHWTEAKHWRTEGDAAWPAEIMVPPVRWLASSKSDGTTGRRFIARLWDASLPDVVAAECASRPGGWPVTTDDVAVGPQP